MVIALLAGAVGGVAAAPGEWYAALNRPSWNPPAWLFGPVWTTLYILMGVAAALVWGGRSSRAGRAGFRLFGLQLILNALWSWLFFHWHRPDLALADLAVLWVSILGTIIAFRRLRPVAGLLLVPYLSWVSFAGVLNASIVARNPRVAPSAQSAGPRREGIAAADCAPWDGSATSIYLSEGGDLKRLPPTPPYLHLIVYQTGDQLPNLRVELGRQESGSGLALRCNAAGECATSNAGVIEFDRSEPDSAVTGSYLLDFAGDSVAGRFLAHWSSRAAICG